MTGARRTVWIALAVLAFAAAAQGRKTAASAKHAPEFLSPVFAGERLDYEFGWNGIPAADVVVRIDTDEYNGRPCYHVRVDMSTKPQVDWIWKMRDRIDTYAEIGTLRPLTYSFRQREGNFSHDTDVVFDQTRKVATSIRKYKGQVKVTTIPCKDVYDPMTALLRMRVSEATIGEEEELLVFDGTRVHTIRYAVQAIGEVETEFGAIRARKVKPWIAKSEPPVRQTDNSKTAKVREVFGWIGLPGDTLLYRIESAVTVGKIYGELVDRQAP